MFKKKNKNEETAVNEVIKVSKKDVFKYKGKTVPKVYIVPDYIRKMYKLKEVCENGVFMYAEDYANKLYIMDVGENVNKATAFKKLRGYDADFSFYYFKDAEYLLVSVSAETINEAIESFDSLENDLFSNMKISDVALENVNFQERMEIIHKGLVNGLNGTPLHVSDYIENVAGYKMDFMFDKYNSVYEDSVTTDTDTYFKMIFVRKANNLDAIVRELNKLSYVEEIKFDFEHIPDQAVVAFYENTYMGYDKEKKIIDKINPELYDILISNPNAEDKRLFTTCGMSVLLKLNSTEEELESISDIEKIFSDNKCMYEYYYGNLLSVYLSFIPFFSHGVKQNRLMQGEKCLVFFLAGKGKLTETNITFSNDYSLFADKEDTEAFSYDDANNEEESDFEKEMASAFDYIV